MRIGPTRPNILASGSSVGRALGIALLTISALAGANAAEPREETGFGSNPGNLRMFSYVPANQTGPQKKAPPERGFSCPHACRRYSPHSHNVEPGHRFDELGRIFAAGHVPPKAFC